MSDPVAIPDVCFAAFQLRPVIPRSVSRMAGRRSETGILGDAWWSLEGATTSTLAPEEVGLMSVFFQHVNTGGGLFLCHDAWNPRPSAYGLSPLSGTKAGGGAFTGAAVLTTVTNAKTLVISGLPAAFAFNAGCLIEVKRTGSIARALHAVSADTVANGSGVATVTLALPLHASFTAANSTINLEKPACLMTLNADWSLPASRDARVASFSGVEYWP